MKIEFNKVTWYSKLSAVIVLILLLPILTFYIGTQYADTMSVLRSGNAVNYESDSQLPPPTIVVSNNVSYDHLFEVDQYSMEYGNVVGYFAHGSFVFYVPDWVAQNWEIMKVDNPNDESMTIMPREPMVMNSISPITFEVKPSSEVYNAAHLYDITRERNYLISGILLSKHAAGGLKIGVESETRIYHVQRETSPETITDFYFIDGGGKTVKVTFSANKEYFNKYSTKVRDLVEGISEMKTPQG